MAKYIDADPEEGEIVSDDFEEISDNSIMSLDEAGKSLGPKEYLPVISLSSITDIEDDETKEMIPKKKFRKFRHHGCHDHHHHHGHKWKRKMKGKCMGKHHRKKKFKLNISDSSSESDYSYDLDLDRKLQYQLKAAIRVEAHAEDNKKCSLQDRLKAMTNAINQIEEKITETSKSDEENKIETRRDSPEIDDELIQLRLEALKTAVINKCEFRRKRKIKEIERNEEESLKNNNLDTNKENTVQDNENVQLKKTCLDKLDVNTLNTTPPDEDEDVLRALLLASMSKRITKDITVNKVETVENNDVKQNNNIIKSNIFVKKTAPPPLRQHIPPKIKPIIININNDSDSEDDKIIDKNITDVPKNVINTEIESSVEKFLKEQRAKVEAQFTKQEKITVNNNKPVVVPVIQKNKGTKPDNLNTSVILEKSAVKLLPKVKQIEYQKLLLKLKNAQKKTRVRRVSHKGGEECNTSKKIIIKNKMQGPQKHFNDTNRLNKVPDHTHDSRRLHIILKQMQKEKDGRLQIGEKYVVLTPILRKINEVTTERKKYEQDVNRLTRELAEAKGKLHTTFKSFSSWVQELLRKKEEIDASSSKLSTCNIKKTNIPLTSTPIKPKINAQQPLELRTVPHSPNSAYSTPSDTPIVKLSPGNNNVLPNEQNPTPDSVVEKILDTIKLSEDSVKRKEEQVICDSVIEIDCNDEQQCVKHNDDEEDDLNPGDPNDIHRILAKQNGIPLYISPLDTNKRDDSFDPFLIMCPFDIDGNCRDPECTYKHYSR